MTRMLFGLQIAHENHSHSHSILPQLGNINRNVNIILKLQLIGLYWNNLNNRHVLDQLFRILSLQATALKIPGSSLNTKPTNIASVLRRLFDILWILELGDYGVQSRFIQGPLLLSTGGLN